MEVNSAGTEPASQVNPKAVEAMKEAGVDSTNHYPKMIDQYLDDECDYMITVCDGANDNKSD